MKKLFSSIILLFIIATTIAQNKTIKGSVMDVDKTPLSGVNIIVKNTKNGTLTDEKGSFEIKNISGEQTIVISYMGYKTKEVLITDFKENLSITLYEGNEVLQEVVLESERKNKFSRKQSAYVAKMPLKNLENSQVYNTVTNQLIVSQNINTLDDALKNATGISKLWNSTGRSNDGAAFYSSRGFAIQPQFVNGVIGITNGTINTSNIERLEVIKGPSGTLFGGSGDYNYGGLINIVTKKPYNGTGGSITASYGSFGFNRLNADVNVTDKSEKFSIRFNAGYQDEDSFQNAGFNKSFFMAPSFSYKANNKLTFNVSYEVNSNEQTNPVSLFFNRSFPLNFNTIDELNLNNDASFTDNSISIKNPTQNYRGEISWKISDKWSSQTLIAGSNAKSSGYYAYLWNQAEYNDDFTVFLGAPSFYTYFQELESETKSINLQQNFNGQFKIGKVNNKLLAGFDYSSKKLLDNSSQFYGINAFNPQGELLFGLETNATNFSTTVTLLDNDGLGYNNSDISSNIFGAYISDVANILPELSIMASIRYDKYQYNGDKNTNSDDDTEFDDATFSPKFGIVYQPILNELSVFANYQNGFTYLSPQYVTTTPEATVENPIPTPVTKFIEYDIEEANQLEFGVKSNLFNNKLEATLSFYNINVDNKYSFFTQTQDLKVNSKGVELDINANPISGLNIRGGFSYNDATVTDSPSNISYEGLRYEQAGPDINYNFWADYRFKQGFGAGIGFNGASDYDAMVFYTATGGFLLPAYTIFNASVYYEHKKFRIGVKANNFTNKEYYTGWSTITPEKPSAFIATLTYKF